MSSIGVYGLVRPLHIASNSNGVAHISLVHGCLFVDHLVLTINSSGVASLAGNPVSLDICISIVSTEVSDSLTIRLLLSNHPYSDLIFDPNIVHQKAFLFIGAPSVFPTQNIATLDGVYVASHPSLGRAPFGVLTSEVPLFTASFNPRTENILTQLLGMFAVLDNISRISDAAPGVITDSSVTTSFS